jgi:hypothetical protein
MSETTKDNGSDTLDTLRKWTRDMFIVAGVVTLVIYPTIIGRFLREAKVELTWDEAAKAWTVKASEDSRDLAGALEDLQREATSLAKQAKLVTSGKADPAFAQLLQQVNDLAAKADDASSSAAGKLATQQAAPGAPDGAQPLGGWMGLGRVASQSSDDWIGKPNIDAESAADLADKTVAVTGNTVLRGDPRPHKEPLPKGFHGRQKVLGAVKVGDMVQIVSTETDETPDGGWAVWARVRLAEK